jgi:putative endonuclease
LSTALRDDWFLYMIRCAGGQLYTGITTDIERRLAEHQAGKGSKYLRGRGPLELVYRQHIGSRADALRAEAAIKRLGRAGKEALVASGPFVFPD